MVEFLRSRVRSSGRSGSSSLVPIAQERNEGPHGGTEMTVSWVIEMEAWIRRRPFSQQFDQGASLKSGGGHPLRQVSQAVTVDCRRQNEP